MAETRNPYSEAYDHTAIVREFVTDNVQFAVDNAEAARTEAEKTLDALAAFAPRLNYTGSTPNAPELDLRISGSYRLPELGSASFGKVDEFVTKAPTLGAVRDIPAIDIEPYVPSFAGLHIPEAPEMTAPLDGPDEPLLSPVTLPDSPVLDKPLFPDLTPIVIPEFEFPTLPAWDVSAPEFEGSAIAGILQWSEEDYPVEIVDEVVVRLREIWAGSNGIPPVVEQAMWERAANREDLDISRQISAADIEYSSRGFTMPPGMHAARIDAIREEGQIKKLGLNREIAIKMAEIQVENMRFAVQQAISAETVLFQIWDATARRQFEAAKVQLDSELALYNAQVALFNARMSAYGTEAQVFKTRLDAELARIEVFKAELEGELAKGQLNEQQVKIYSERIRALLTDVEVYKAEMDGAKIQSELNSNQIDVFKAQVQAYAERIQADKVRFDAYESRVKGELGKAQVMDSEARAYASYVSGKATVADIGVKIAQNDIAKNELLIREYVAKIDADKARIEGQLAAVRANADAHQANTSRYVAQAGVEEAQVRLEITGKEAEMRTNISLYEVEMRKYIADMEQLIRKAQIQLEALKAAGQVSATLAAGAMAGISIGANLSGSGGVSASGSANESTSRSESTNHNYSY